MQKFVSILSTRWQLDSPLKKIISKLSTATRISLALPGILGALLTSCAPEADSLTSDSGDNLNDIVAEFLHTGLAFQNHDATPYLYLGAQEDIDAARADARDLTTLIGELNVLLSRLRALPDNTEESEGKRRAHLEDRIASMIARGDILLNNLPESFNQEAELVFGVDVPLYDTEHFRALTSQLDALIPGEGPLAERVAEFREQFVIPVDKLEIVIGAAMQECRSRTLQHFTLPPNERVTLNITSNKHWVGFTEFRGNSHSVIHLNADVPVHIERAIELGCHEGYPGHHAHASMLEEEIINSRGWDEYKLVTLLGPYSVITEGAASFAEHLAFTRSERMAFDRDILLPLAGIDASDIERYYHFVDLVGELNFARNTAASAYLYEGMSRDDAISWLMEYGLETRGTASQRLDFIDAQRAYVVTYNYGKRIVEDYIGEVLNQDPEQAWSQFSEILLTPMMPADLLR